MKATRVFKPMKTAYLFMGEETFLIEEQLTHVRNSLGEGDSMNNATYHAQEIHRIDEVITLCNTLPFLSDRRLIVIRNAHKLSAKDLTPVISYLKDPCESTTLILTIEGTREDKKLSKTLSPGTIEVLPFNTIKGRELTDWITDRAKKFHKTIDKDASFLLADATAGNMWYIASEIEKLSLYVGERANISAEDVGYLVMPSLEPPVFSFMDSLFDKKKDVASRLYELELTGIAELMIISQILKLTTQHYQVLIENRRNVQGINPYVEKKIAQRRSLWSAHQLLSLLDGLRGVEHGIKSGRTLHPLSAVHEVIMGVVFPA